MSARAAEDDDALPLFDQALALWRGEAFAGLDTPSLSALRDQLHQHRWAVELDRNDVALRRGRHTGLLPGLSARARAYPLDERLGPRCTAAWSPANACSSCWTTPTTPTTSARCSPDRHTARSW